MAAEVSSVTRTLKRYAEDEKGKRELVTRDLLGGGAVVGNGELDLEIKVVRSGWERRIDLMPAKNYQPLHDLNLPPPPPPPSACASASTADFNLLSAAPSRASHSSSSPAVSAYSSSVCTLDKVRSALERESRGARPAPRSDSSSSPSSSSSAAAAAKRLQSPPPRDSPISGGEMRAAACPTCLIYVLIAAVDPRCPRCDAQVPALPVLTQPHKKPRIDLNAAAEDND
ncbi:uncharacterized protein [Typha angustifolia]|uniref:uncharacterized protein n=1 Tax=Typha angustifolia TaxID=59011 RepID=UPI003C2D284A